MGWMGAVNSPKARRRIKKVRPSAVRRSNCHLFGADERLFKKYLDDFNYGFPDGARPKGCNPGGQSRRPLEPGWYRGKKKAFAGSCRHFQTKNWQPDK